MKKYIIIMFVAGIGFVLGQALKTHEVEIESITVGIQGDPASGKPQKKEEIPVTVTLTKYQLAKMLEILEEENSYGRPADPQDTYTFYSVAKSYADSKEYNISSTHLAKRLIK
tara:strand:- start:103 stop:441 length:339 start_codon:yes stop_codon:yes gene_type:complete